MAVKITKDNLEEIVKINKEIQDEIDGCVKKAHSYI